MSAGDLARNIGRIIGEFVTDKKEELRIVSQLVELSTKIETLSDLWEESDKSYASKTLIYDPWSREHHQLRVYVAAHRDEIVGVLPKLEESILLYLAPNPYDANAESDLGYSNVEFDYKQKVEFHETLEHELAGL
jgi:hypothetical protein